MTVTNRSIVLGLALFMSGGCAKGPEPTPTSASRSAAAPDAKAGKGNATETRLPPARPTPFSVNYQAELAAEERDTLHLADKVTRRGSSRGRRHFKVSYRSDAPTLDRVYAALRDNACDRIKTELTRNPGNTGTILQLRAGKVHHVINDRGKFFPAAEWTEAYKACAAAANSAFVEPGDRAHASFEIRYADEKLPVAVLAVIDLGPDLLGLAWSEDQRTLTVHSATIRPVEVTTRSGKTEERTMLDLATHDAVVLKTEGDPKAETFKVVLSATGGPAKTTGDVPTGTDERAEPDKKPAAEPAATADKGTAADKKPAAGTAATPDKGTAADKPPAKATAETVKTP